jgi:hypothetical protein
MPQHKPKQGRDKVQSGRDRAPYQQIGFGNCTTAVSPACCIPQKRLTGPSSPLKQKNTQGTGFEQAADTTAIARLSKRGFRGSGRFNMDDVHGREMHLRLAPYNLKS